jgi:hypothetical protein
MKAGIELIGSLFRHDGEAKRSIAQHVSDLIIVACTTNAVVFYPWQTIAGMITAIMCDCFSPFSTPKVDGRGRTPLSAAVLAGTAFQAPLIYPALTGAYTYLRWKQIMKG